MKDETRKDLTAMASVASVGASYAALALALMNKKPEEQTEEYGLKIIRETADKEWIFAEPYRRPPNDNIVAEICYDCGHFEMWSFLYKDGHIDHAWTSFEDQHEEDITPEVRQIAEEELVKFAIMNGLKVKKNPSKSKKKHRFWPF